MPRSHALRALARLAAVHAAADSEGVSAGRIRDEMSLSRRDFARGLLAASATLPLLAGCSVESPAANKRVAIIGAGIAGLDRRVAPARRGHRFDRLRVVVPHRRPHAFGMVVLERSPAHRMVRRDDRHATRHDARAGTAFSSAARRYVFGPQGRRPGHGVSRRPYYPMPEADRDFAAIYPILKSQLAAMPATPMYSNMTAAGHRLDQTEHGRLDRSLRPGRPRIAAGQTHQGGLPQRIRTRNRGAEFAQSRVHARHPAAFRERRQD